MLGALWRSIMRRVRGLPRIVSEHFWFDGQYDRHSYLLDPGPSDAYPLWIAWDAPDESLGLTCERPCSIPKGFVEQAVRDFDILRGRE